MSARLNKARSRYRVEDGIPCIDVSAKSIEHLHDNRDPAPFRDRDLDPSLVEYLIGAAEELASSKNLCVVFWLADPCLPGEIEAAHRAHFGTMLDRIARRNRQRHRTGVSVLALAVVLLVLLFSLSQFMQTKLTGPIGTALTEGVVILSWIVLWRPAEVLLYDWIPLRQERKVIAKLLAARVDMRSGTPPQG